MTLGCGQGRDAIPLARLGYSVLGIDHSKVGIEQVNQVARNENLDLAGQVGDIYLFHDFGKFDIVLLDSMFHFTKKDKDKEVGLVKKIISKISTGCLLVICIQDTGKKVHILNQAIDFERRLDRLVDKKFRYVFEDDKHRSESDYRMIVVVKMKTLVLHL